MILLWHAGQLLAICQQLLILELGVRHLQCRHACHTAASLLHTAYTPAVEGIEGCFGMASDHIPIILAGMYHIEQIHDLLQLCGQFRGSTSGRRAGCSFSAAMAMTNLHSSA